MEGRKMEEGFTADCEYLRLFVEAEDGGWEVCIYDLKKGQWITLGERVDTPEAGKRRAIEIAAVLLGIKDDLQPEWKPL
jgi:hypothetical protein